MISSQLDNQDIKVENFQSQLQNFKQFIQQKIQELDKSFNKFICAQAKFFFDCSEQVKTNIFEEWKKVNSSKELQKQLTKSIEFINQTIKNVIEQGSIILDHTKYVLEQSIGQNNPFQNIFQGKEYNIKSQNNERKVQTSTSSRKYQSYQDPQVVHTECPICQVQLSNGQTFVKHIRKHDIDIQSQGYDCPHCDVTFSQCCLLLSHLFKRHYVQEDFRNSRRIFYYCPFTKRRYSQNQRSQLSHFIRSSPNYSKALDQILVAQLNLQNKAKVTVTEEMKLQFKQKMPNQPNMNAEFIRGVTKVVQINKKLYACPLCGLEEFRTHKYVAGHIRSAHRIKFRNNLFCPHCQNETRYARDLSIHLVCAHGRVEKNSTGVRRQIYTTLNGIEFEDSLKLTRYIINDDNYLTFYNSICKDVPFGLLTVKEKEENVQSNNLSSDND